MAAFDKSSNFLFMDKSEITDILEEIAVLLELKGENPFKARAYTNAARALDLPRHELAQILQVDVAGNKLRKGVGDGDDGLAEVAVLHPGGAPQRARSGHIASMRRGS